MEKDVCWERFMVSGSVADYLAFKQKEQDETSHFSQGAKPRTAEKEPGGFGDRVEHNAGFY